MTRRERIEFLLENYLEVEHGLQEPRSGPGDYVPQMCRAYRHPSYIELRRCLDILQRRRPVVWWHLAETYFRFEERRVTVCPRCKKEYPPGLLDGMAHKHGNKSVDLVPMIVRRISKLVDTRRVEEAIDWLEDVFRGEVFIPDELLVYAAA